MNASVLTSNNEEYPFSALRITSIESFASFSLVGRIARRCGVEETIEPELGRPDVDVVPDVTPDVERKFGGVACAARNLSIGDGRCGVEQDMAVRETEIWNGEWGWWRVRVGLLTGV